MNTVPTGGVPAMLTATPTGDVSRELLEGPSRRPGATEPAGVLRTVLSADSFLSLEMWQQCRHGLARAGHVQAPQVGVSPAKAFPRVVAPVVASIRDEKLPSNTVEGQAARVVEPCTGCCAYSAKVCGNGRDMCAMLRCT